MYIELVSFQLNSWINNEKWKKYRIVEFFGFGQNKYILIWENKNKKIKFIYIWNDFVRDDNPITSLTCLCRGRKIHFLANINLDG